MVVESLTLAKELGLDGDAAQKLFDARHGASSKETKRIVDASNQVAQKWIENIVSDKEFGGEKVQENIKIAQRVIEKFGTPQLRELFNQTHLGNHPELMRVFYRIGLGMKDDRVITGDGTAPAGQTTIAKTLYPNMK